MGGYYFHNKSNGCKCISFINGGAFMMIFVERTRQFQCRQHRELQAWETGIDQEEESLGFHKNINFVGYASSVI